MKKVLVTGASGSIGINVIKFLLSEGKYEITALDLRNKKTYNKLKKYQKRIKIIYGDISDKSLMEVLIKENDYVIHLASVLPPLGEFSKKIGEIVEYEGTLNIINAINNVNKKCCFIYASTTSLYDKSLGADINENIKVNDLSNYSYIKYQTENLIKSKLSKYTILRIPLVLSSLKKEPFIYNVKSNNIVEVTTSLDAAYAFVKAINYFDKLNKNTYNVGMGIKGRCKYNDILNNILKYYGISFNYIFSRIFLEKNYISPILTDSDELEDIIHYRSDNLVKYYKRLNNKGKKRIVQKLLGRIVLFCKKG